MKKRALTLISLLLAVLLFAGCAGDAAAVSYVHEPIPVPQREMVCFEDMEYVRFDLEAMYATVDALHEALKSPFKIKEIDALLADLDMQSLEFETMYALAEIRSCLDVKDEFYDEEYTWCMEADAEVQMLAEEALTACADSIHSFWIEPYYFWDGFSEEYRTVEAAEPVATYEDYFDVVRRQTELLACYRDVMSSIIIELDGQEWELNEYVQQADAEQAVQAYELYYEKYNPILGEIYLELIELRREYAQLYGYDSYAELEYDLGYGRSYTVEQSEAYLRHIKNYMGELGRWAEELGLWEELIYDPVDERELELYLETAVEGFGGQTEQAYKFMKEYRLYDFSISSDKANISFQSYLSGYNAPYLFLCPYGYTDDIMTVCHEFGHYVDAYIRGDAYESMDLAEVYSQAMQLLSMEQLNCVMTDLEYSNFRNMTLLDILSSFQDQAALAEFELRAHDMEAPTVEKLNELYSQLLEEYGMDGAGIAPESWIDIPHLFETPFYVISYPVSAAVALELYEIELQETGSGIKTFILMSESQLAGLMETAEYAGLDDPLSESRIRSAAKFLGSQLQI